MHDTRKVLYKWKFSRYIYFRAIRTKFSQRENKNPAKINVYMYSAVEIPQNARK
jgi:hypothetical protein